MKPLSMFAALKRARRAEPVELADRAVVLGELLFKQQQWQLRKVQSHRLEEGSYSTVRVSVDFVLQDFRELRYWLGGGSSSSSPTDMTLVVPLTYMRKGVLRSFDLRGPGGESLSVIGRSEYRVLMAEVLFGEVSTATYEDEGAVKALRLALETVVDADVKEATIAATELLHGRVGDRMVLDPTLLTAFSRALLSGLASSYVLLVLMPAEYAGRRTVVKYSHHTEQQPDGLSFWRRCMGAAGLQPLEASFALSHPAGSASHHLEIGIPSEVECRSLQMPDVEAADRNTEDVLGSGLVHAVASYVENPANEAVAQFWVPWRGTRAIAWLVAATTFTILTLGLLLPGAQDALIHANDGAAALLLSVPAVAIALIAGRRENVLVAALMRPLRLSTLVCALILLAAAGSVVGVLHQPFRFGLWALGVVVSGGATVLWGSSELVGMYRGVVAHFREWRIARRQT